MTHSQIKERLLSARLALGLSQRELAARAGVTHSTICHLEGGRDTGRAGVLEKIAAALGLELILDVATPEDAKAYRFVELVRGIDDADMSRLERIATAMRLLDEPLMKDVLVATMESAGGVRKVTNPFK